MDFFEQLGKRISDAGQSVAKQTKNIADVTQLNSGISDMEKKIAKLYAAIGEAYYERHKDDANAEELDKIREITSLYEEINVKREKINQIKGIEICENCGAEIADNAVFCNSCGNKIERSVNTEPVNEDVCICPNCNNPVVKGNAFCNQCGTKLTND